MEKQKQAAGGRGPTAVPAKLSAQVIALRDAQAEMDQVMKQFAALEKQAQELAQRRQQLQAQINGLFAAAVSAAEKEPK